MTKQNKTQEQDTKVEQNMESNQPNWQDKYARALADYQNLIRQHQKDRQEYLKYANQSLIIELLPLIDSLDLAANHGQDPGIVMIAKQLKQTVESQGINFITPTQGEPFDPQLHECVDLDSSSDSQTETIAKNVQSGARWQDGQVIRPAQVVVFRQADQIDQSSEPKKPVDSA